jgi:hypothetical protein
LQRTVCGKQGETQGETQSETQSGKQSRKQSRKQSAEKQDPPALSTPDPPAVSRHPRGHNLSLQTTGPGLSKSLIVFMKGYTSGKSAGIGVYFGPESRYNIKETVTGLDSEDRENREKAELHALSRTLECMKSRVLPNHQTLFNSIRSSDSTGANLRLILATDSTYVVQCMCKCSKHWIGDSAGEIRLANSDHRGGILEKSKLWVPVFSAVKELSVAGVLVVCYQVPSL